MITSPINWPEIGKKPTLERIRLAMRASFSSLPTYNLALSGGLDSTLALSFMVRVLDRDKIKCYTIALNEGHPDYTYSKMAASYFCVEHHILLPPHAPANGDGTVKVFFEWLHEKGVRQIVTCDGIDEFMAGYYAHQDCTQETYDDFISRLYVDQLLPLNNNSGPVEVFLPYLDLNLILLLNQIPLKDKVNQDGRKLIMQELAKGAIPDEIINRRKYGFCDAMTIKVNRLETI